MQVTLPPANDLLNPTFSKTYHDFQSSIMIKVKVATTMKGKTDTISDFHLHLSFNLNYREIMELGRNSSRRSRELILEHLTILSPNFLLHFNHTTN